MKQLVQLQSLLVGNAAPVTEREPAEDARDVRPTGRIPPQVVLHGLEGLLGRGTTHKTYDCSSWWNIRVVHQVVLSGLSILFKKIIIYEYVARAVFFFRKL